MKKYVLLAIALALVSSCARPILRVLPVPPGCSALEPLPLTVDVDVSAAGYRADINHAMKSWDKAVGKPTFVWNGVDETPADVFVAAGPLYGNVRGVGPSFCHDGHVSSVIVLDTGLDVVAATAFAAHELGHALGLGHSEVRESIMYYLVDASLMGDWDRQTNQRILPTDARVAAALHAGGPSALAPSDAGPSTGVGTSPSALPDPSNPAELAGGITGAARAGKWLLVIALIVNAVVWLLRRFTPFVLRKLGAWVGEDRGGTILALTIGVLTVFVIQASSGHVDVWLILDGLAAGLLGVGNYTAPKKLGGNP